MRFELIDIQCRYGLDLITNIVYTLKRQFNHFWPLIRRMDVSEEKRERERKREKTKHRDIFIKPIK